MTLKTREADRALVSKLGFEKAETHHHVYRLWVGGTLVVRTYISHGERELSHFHIGEMAKQMRLQAGEFPDAVNGPLSRDEYYNRLRQRVPGLGET